MDQHQIVNKIWISYYAHTIFNKNIFFKFLLFH